MAKNDNLTDYLIDLADGIRAKKGTTEPINPQDFRKEIESISGGGSAEGESVKYYRGTLGFWSELLSSCPVFMPIKTSGAEWLMLPSVALIAGMSAGLLVDGKTTIIKSYSSNADFRDNPTLSQVGVRSFEEYVEFVRTQGAAMGINEEYTEITEDEFYTLFEQIKNADSAE